MQGPLYDISRNIFPFAWCPISWEHFQVGIPHCCLHLRTNWVGTRFQATLFSPNVGQWIYNEFLTLRHTFPWPNVDFCTNLKGRVRFANLKFSTCRPHGDETNQSFKIRNLKHFASPWNHPALAAMFLSTHPLTWSWINFSFAFFLPQRLLQTVLLVNVYANNEHERQKSRAQAFNIPMLPRVLRNVRGTRLWEGKPGRIGTLCWRMAGSWITVGSWSGRPRIVKDVSRVFNLFF